MYRNYVPSSTAQTNPVHPKVCKFFCIQKTCKFGEHCDYKYDAISNKGEIDELHVKGIHLEASNELMLAKLNDFTK